MDLPTENTFRPEQGCIPGGGRRQASIAFPTPPCYIETAMTPALQGKVTTWTVLSLLQWADGFLAQKGYDESRLTSELLLSHVLGLPRLNLYLQFDRPLNQEELARFKGAFQRRLAHEPLQYIVGECEFMGLRIAVDKRVLIPRPETEDVVSCALDALRSRNGQSLTILDIGTGSGNMAVALAKSLPRATVTAVDVSTDALDVARANAEAHGVHNISFQRWDVLGDLPADWRFDMIVANPPYVSLHDFESVQEEIRNYEPRQAVTDGGDGLKFIRRILGVAPKHLVPGGAVAMEIAYGQEGDARALASAAGLRQVDVRRDFVGVPRVLIAVWEGS